MSEYTINDRNGETRIEGTIDPDPAFTGGTIAGPLQIDPTDDTVTAIRVDMPTGAAANATDWIDIRSETAGHRFEADAAGNFLVDARPTGQIRFTDNSPVDVFLADGSSVAVGTVGDTQPLWLFGSDLNIGSASASLGFFGATPDVKPAVTGAKLPSDVVIASLLAALAALGLITDSTT